MTKTFKGKNHNDIHKEVLKLLLERFTNPSVIGIEFEFVFDIEEQVNKACTKPDFPIDSESLIFRLILWAISH